MKKKKNRIKKIAQAIFFFQKKEKKEILEKTLFSIVKALKKEEKKILKASYPHLKTPLDNQIARLKAQNLPPYKKK